MEADFTEGLEAELLRNGGVVSYRVEDGHVFVFEEALLEKLLNKARNNESHKVIIFVKRGAEA